MPMFETFSKRRRKQDKAGQVDVYQYDELPKPLRIQILHIWRYINECLDKNSFSTESKKSTKLWEYIENLLARELGVMTLYEKDYWPYDKCEHSFLTASNEDALDLVDLSLNDIGGYIYKYEDQKFSIMQLMS